MTAALRAISDQSAGIVRVEMSADGLAKLSAAGRLSDPVAAEFFDSAGNICGRATRYASPSSTSSHGMEWHVQVGGVLGSREWSGRPMGCGSGATPWDAAQAAIDDLKRRSAELAAQASRVACMLGR